MHNNNKSNQSGVVLLTRAWTLITLLKKQNGLATSAMFQHASSPSSSSSLTLFPTHTNVVIIYPRSYISIWPASSTYTIIITSIFFFFSSLLLFFSYLLLLIINILLFFIIFYHSLFLLPFFFFNNNINTSFLFFLLFVVVVLL